MEQALRHDGRVGHAARLIEQHLNEEIDYDRIAAKVGLSASRFHHVFTEKTGEAPGAYLRRIRMDAAAVRLRWTDETVSRIAAAVGYSSHPSFTKAFTNRFGVSPVAFRTDRDRWPIESSDNVRDKRVRLVEHDGFRLLARRYIGAPCDMYDYWQHFLANLPDDMGAGENHIFAGLVRDDMRFTPPDQVRYDCCIVVGEAFDAPEFLSRWPDFTIINIEPALCARLHYKGHYAGRTSPDGSQCISRAYGYLFDEWMPASSFTFDSDYAMEVYSVPHTRCEVQDLECTIIVPLR
jgi:AraC family transcriptional regulator